MCKILWKDVLGYEGIYQVSNDGRVRSLDRVKKIKSRNQHGEYLASRQLRGVELKHQIDVDGYYRVLLFDNAGKKRFRPIHRLVAEAFVSGDTSLVVDHVDGNKTNNHYSNLEFVTVKENTNRAENLGLRTSKGSGNNRALLVEADVSAIRKLKAKGKHLDEVSKLYPQVSIHTFRQIWYYQTWKHVK